MDSETVLISAISGVAASLVGTPLAHWLATRRHISQRWWETKADAYSSIMSGLAKLRAALEDLTHEFSYGPDAADPKTVEKRMALWERAAEDIAFVAHQAQFKVSAETDRILEIVVNSLHEPMEDPMTNEGLRRWFLTALVHVRLATASLSTEARHDLGVLGPRGELLRLIGEKGSLRRQQLTPWQKRPNGRSPQG